MLPVMFLQVGQYTVQGASAGNRAAGVARLMQR